MALQSQTEIYIGSTKIESFKRFVLNQDINAHHFLQLECRTDVLEELNSEISNITKNYLGETIKLQVASLSGYSEYKELLFKGVVTSITNKKGYNNQHMVTITAQSPTVLCDDGANYNSYIDNTLSTVVSSALEGYDTSKLTSQITPENDTSLHYTVQHKESSWHFMSRLAMQYGEWFFYDGEKLVFGKPEDGDATLLTYGHDLKEFSLDLIPLSNKFNYFSNDYLLDESHEKKSDEVTTSASGYSDFVNEKSEGIYPKETNVFVNKFNDPTLKQRIDTHVERQKKATETQQVRLKGSSDNPGVAIGKIIEIKNDTTSHGQFRVINVRHVNNENGQYNNVFEAVSTDVDVFIDTDIQIFPKSETQTAVVMENIDPESLARVKVQLPWQKLTGEMTPWIRVVTPHGGAEKGFHFIPEIGEEVLIAFEGSNAERPYMMGSLYNGSSKAEGWKTENNDIKAIKTRSGHTLMFSDEDGKETIIITDKNSNFIILDTVEKSITLSAPESINIASKSVNISGTDNVTITSNTLIHAQSGDKVVINGTNEVSASSDKKVAIKGNKEVTVDSDVEVKITGASKATLSSSAVTAVEGTIIKLN